jgi:hypothetical protein
MKQPHTETTTAHTDDQQNTGNHKKPNTQESGSVNRIGGTRAGAENLEPVTPQASATDKLKDAPASSDPTKT